MKTCTRTTAMSFLSLPHDVVLNCLARVSRIHHPTLSLVSKTFQSLLASPELYATRSRIGKTENCFYVCLQPSKNPNPSWFMLAPIPKQQKLIPIPSFPSFQHPKYSTVLTIGSEIYIIGGYVDEKRSKKVFVLDCRSYQWRQLPEMRVAPPMQAAADVIDGKICVIGGCCDDEDFGEMYDLKTQTWEPLSPKTLDLTVQKSVVPGKLVMGGQVYGFYSCGRYYNTSDCLVEIEKTLYQTCVDDGKLIWQDPMKDHAWRSVEGLEGLSSNSKLPYLGSVTNSTDGRRLIVWWMSVKDGDDGHYSKKIWCAEISFERRGLRKLWGFVEWSKNVFTFNKCTLESKLFWHSAIVTL